MSKKINNTNNVTKEPKSNQKPRPCVNTEDKLLWSVREASAYTGIGESKIRSMAKADDCPFSLRIGRKISIKPKELKKYLSNVKTL